MHTPTEIHAPLTLQAYEVEEAFMAACAQHAFRDPDQLARLSQSVCHWHRLDPSGRANVLQHIRNYFPVH